MHSTHAITQQLKSAKIKSAEDSDMLGYYLQQIAGQHQKGEMDPRVILMHLLGLYLEDPSSCCPYNELIADLIFDFAAKFESKDTRINFMFSAVRMINNNIDVMEEDDNLTALFGAFFSLYENYQFHLSEQAKIKFAVFDYWQAQIRRRLHFTLAQLKGDNVWWHRTFHPVCDAREGQITACQRIRDLSELFSLKEVEFSKELIKQLLHCVSFKKVKKINQREMACVALIELRDKMSPELCIEVLRKAYRMTKSKIRNMRGMGCALLGAFYHFLPGDDQPYVMQFFLRNLVNPFIAGYSLQALLMIPEEIPECLLHLVMQEIKPGTLFLGSVLYHEPFKRLLTLLDNIHEDVRNSLPSFLVHYRRESITSPINHVLNRYWAWLTVKEKETIAEEAVTDIENAHSPDRQNAMHIIAYIGPDLFPKKTQAAFYEYLLHCLKDKSLEKSALGILISIANLIPKKSEAEFVAYLWNAFENINHDNFYLQVQVMSQLCHAMDKDQQTRLVMKVISLLDPNLPENTRTFYQLHHGACLAIGHLLHIIPADCFQEIVDRLVVNITRLNSPHSSAIALQYLADVLPDELKIRTAMQLFDIACESKLTRRHDCTNALQPYLRYLHADLKVAMLNRVAHMDEQKAGKDVLFVHLHQSYQHELVKQVASHVKHQDFYLPNEIVAEIMSLSDDRSLRPPGKG